MRTKTIQFFEFFVVLAILLTPLKISPTTAISDSSINVSKSSGQVSSIFIMGADSENPGNRDTVEVNFGHDNTVSFSKLGPAKAQEGDVIRYSLLLTSTTLLNDPAWLTDTLPAGVEFAGGLNASSGSASYITATNSVYWNNLPPPLSSIGNRNPSQVRHPLALILDSVPAGANIVSAAMPDAVVSMALDDGSVEHAIGKNENGLAYQYVWFNRFTPDAGDFPFTLNQIDIYLTAGSNAMVGDPIDLVVYNDTDGDPSNGAQWLKTYSVNVQVVPGLNSYDISSDPVILTGPGDVLIGAINRYTVSGVDPSSYPSAQDATSSQGRSWVATYTTDPPDPATLPSDDLFSLIDDLGVPGNWIIRGYGETGVKIQVNFNATVTAEAGTTITNTADLNYNGVMYMANSTLNVGAPTAMFTSNSPIMLGETAIFTPTVTGIGPFDYIWDFGDEITSTMDTPTHTYMMPGTYMVTFAVTSIYGMDSYSEEFIVNPVINKIYLPVVMKVP